MNVKNAVRFYEAILLLRIHNDIKYNKRLHFALYQAMKKSLYKPAAFFKGILLPLCQEGNCNLREAVIIGSILEKCTIPPLHASATLMKLADMEYCGTTSGWRPDSLRPDGPPSSRFGGNSGCPQCRTLHAGRSWPAYVPVARPDAAPAAGELSKGGEGEFSIDIPARCTGHGSDVPFSAITPGGIPTHTDICLGACDRFFHIVAHGGAGETAYFAVPREMASPGVVGPRGFAHINLVTGAVGVIDQIERAPGVAACLSVRVLADAMTCDSPLELVPHRGVLPACVGSNSAARDLSPALRAAAAPAPVTMQVAAPMPVRAPAPAPAPVAMQVAAPAPVQAPAPAPAPRKRGRLAKATAPATVPANAVAAPPLPPAAVPLKRSARVRDMGGHLFESVMERAVRLKAMKAGDGDAAPSASVPPPFRTDEIVAMARACQLPDEGARDLLSAFAVPEAAP